MEPPTRISTTMALDALQELCEDIQSTRHALQDKIEARDALIRSAKASGIPYKTLGRVTRLGINRLQAINAKPEQEPTE